MVDLSQELANAQWRKSSFSGHDGSDCVETARLSDGRRAVRDSKDHGLPAAVFTGTAWTDFLTTIKNRHFT